MIKQSKGKALEKLPTSAERPNDKWFMSVKYDGNYVQIHKNKDKVRFYTSGGKEFYIQAVAEEVLHIFQEFDNIVLEAEFVYKDGELGQRGKSALLTTFRTEFKKGIASTMPEDFTFVIFDYISSTIQYKDRVKVLTDILAMLISSKPNYIYVCEHRPYNSSLVDLVLLNGMEGVVAKHPEHLHIEGKRTNLFVKIKKRPTADLECVGVTDGEGKYEGLIGALVLKDKEGRVVRVGSGLSDTDRKKAHSAYIGKIIEIEYEQIQDTYIQPVYKSVREDKTKGE